MGHRGLVVIHRDNPARDAGDQVGAVTFATAGLEHLAARAPRVSLVIKADIRPSVTGAMTAKVETIERYLGG